MTVSWLITGASRGIGLSVVEDLLKDEKNFVIATARNPDSAEGLKALSQKFPESRLALIKLDVTKADEIAKAVEAATLLLPQGLDYFISNAGIINKPLTSFDDLDLDEFLEELKFNTVTPIEITRAFLPLIRKSEKKKILYITSILGSISVGGVWPVVANSYAVSKAALNMLVRKWGSFLKMEGISFSVIHPGWVVTEGWRGYTALDGEVRAGHCSRLATKQRREGIIKLAEDLTLEQTTSFFNYDGSMIGW
ncbi:hypothetical protein DFP72DRAFT_1007961 [Ephemerocybe angulata]|uniref:NAD(P)-binding protein n=1 Tax=Ephemerocybe angulata TaxID=980116 RepID=A0A8H6M679_9AGAR|nr:hypothetical protein DFP72DRAFT_1007961 [Tulosesus angulatus]